MNTERSGLLSERPPREVYFFSTEPDRQLRDFRVGALCSPVKKMHVNVFFGCSNHEMLTLRGLVTRVSCVHKEHK